MPSATSQRLRLDLKCGVSPGPKCSGRTSRSNRKKTDPGNAVDERHGWRLSQHQSRPASETRPGPDRRDLEYQESEAEATSFAYWPPCPNWPELTLSSAVTNPGCERTAGKITRSRELVNRTLEKIERILDFFSSTDRVVRYHSMEIGSTSTATSTSAGARMPAGHRSRQDLERLRLRATKLKVEPVKIADLDYRVQVPDPGSAPTGRPQDERPRRDRSCTIERSLPWDRER